jgi:saccharopine dehydrogenase-like NADP-dependent oxidoreductase
MSCNSFAVSVNCAYQLEQLYNRDSLPYIHEYGLEGVQSMHRGTLRYRGFSATMDSLKSIGFFNDEPCHIPPTWPELIQAVIKAAPCR